MKKVALSLLALAVVGVSAFAEAPKWDPKVSTGLKGEASLTVGYDADTSVVAMANSSKVSLIVDLVSGGDAVTASDKDVWGEIRVKTDGDPYRIKADGVAPDQKATFEQGFKLQLDYAKIHFGKDAYLRVDAHGTDIGYANSPDLAFKTVKRSGQYGGTAVATWPTLSGKGPTGVAGFEVGYSIPSVAGLTVDLANETAWNGAGPNLYQPNLSYKAAIDVTAVPNLTLQAGYSASTKEKTDKAAGAKLGYKLALGEKEYLKPTAGLTMVQLTGEGDWLPQYFAGVLYALDGKGDAFDNYGLKYGSDDYGAYPGVAFGIESTDKKIAGGSKDKLSLNVSANSGALVADTSVVAAFEIADLNADKKDSVFTAGASTKVVSGDVTISPKGTFNYESNELADATYIYAKATADVTGVIPFVTFTVNYESNDLSGKDLTTKDKKVGKFEFTTKISF